VNKNKQKYKGKFNWHGQIFEFWVYGVSKYQAKSILIRQLAKRLNRPVWGVRQHYLNASANIEIKQI